MSTTDFVREIMSTTDFVRVGYASDIIAKAGSIRKATTEIINETEHWSKVVCSNVYWSPLHGDWVVLIDSSDNAALISKIIADLLQLGHDVSVISG